MSEPRKKPTTVHSPRPIRLDRLHPNPENPRLAGPEQSLEALRASMEKFGVVEGAPAAFQPVVYRREDGLIVSGQRRYEAAVSLGYETIWGIPVDLSDEQLRELTVRLNVPAGTWDWEQLALQFDSEDLQGWGMVEIELPKPVPAAPLELAVGPLSESPAVMRGLPAPPPLSAPAAESLAGEEAGELPRQVAFFYSLREFEEMQTLVRKIMKRGMHGENASAVVLAALRETAERLEVPAPEAEGEAAPAPEEEEPKLETQAN